MFFREVRTSQSVDCPSEAAANSVIGCLGSKRVGENSQRRRFSLKSYLPAHSTYYKKAFIVLALFADAIRAMCAEAKKRSASNAEPVSPMQSARCVLRQSKPTDNGEHGKGDAIRAICAGAKRLTIMGAISPFRCNPRDV